MLLLSNVEIARSAGSEPPAPAGDVEVDPVTGKRYRRVRPEGLRRGVLAVERWVPISVAALLAVLAGVVLVRATRGERR